MYVAGRELRWNDWASDRTVGLPNFAVQRVVRLVYAGASLANSLAVLFLIPSAISRGFRFCECILLVNFRAMTRWFQGVIIE